MLYNWTWFFFSKSAIGSPLVAIVPVIGIRKENTKNMQVQVEATVFPFHGPVWMAPEMKGVLRIITDVKDTFAKPQLDYFKIPTVHLKQFASITKSHLMPPVVRDIIDNLFQFDARLTVQSNKVEFSQFKPRL